MGITRSDYLIRHHLP